MTDPDPAIPSSELPAAQNVAGGTTPVISSTDIFRGEREVLIKHGDEVYRLRLTRNGKLILHK